MRVVWKELLASTAWRANAWAHVTLGQLGEAVARSRDCPKKYPRATVRRWLAWLVDRGEFERRCVPAGGTLPDGSVAWCPHWVVLPGQTMQARVREPMIPGRIIFNTSPDRREEARRPNGEHSEASRKQAGPAKRRAARTASPARGASPLKEDSCLSSFSGSGSRSETLKLRTKPRESEKGAELAAPVRLLAEKVLRNYAEASGVRVVHFRASSRAIVAACLDEMEGDDAAKEMRLRAVIDNALAESRAHGIAHPPLAYVFSVRHVRRRLERLAEAEHLAQKAADAGGDMFAAGFDGALAEARAELAAGVAPTALDRARLFIDHRLVTDAARMAAFHALADAPVARPSPPLTKAARPLRRPAQDAPQRDLCPLGSASRPVRSEVVSGPEEALRALTALFATVTEPSPPPGGVTEAPLTAAERAELEAAQVQARARWARAG
jgi:hypothetical protein